MPKISVAPSYTLDPNNPLFTPFILINEGRLTIHSIAVSAYVIDVKTESNFEMDHIMTRIVDSFSPSLVSGKSTTIGIPGNWGFLRPVSSATVEIVVYYRPSFWPSRLKQSFRFQMIKTASNERLWLPVEE
jgi:hypothetical protein